MDEAGHAPPASDGSRGDTGPDAEAAPLLSWAARAAQLCVALDLPPDGSPALFAEAGPDPAALGALLLAPGDPALRARWLGAALRGDGHRLARLAWGIPLLEAGFDPQPWAAALDALGPLADLIHGGRLLTRPGVPEPELRARTVALFAPLRADGALQAALDLALAGRLDRPARRVALCALLGSSAAQRALGATVETALAAARAAIPADTGPPQALARLPDQLAAEWRPLAAALRLQGWLRPDPQAGWTRAAPQAALTAALAFLAEDPSLSATRELQRWGVTQTGQTLRSDWFQRGIVLQAEADCGLDNCARIHALLAGIPAGGLRWYGAWRGIPPDADSLGLMLQLGSDHGGLSAEKAESWLAFLRASLPADGLIPTWFYQGPDGPAIEGEGWVYARNDCATARTTAATGLLAWDAAGWGPVLAANAAAVLAFLSGEPPSGDFYYSPAYASLIAQRFVTRYQASGPDPAMARALTAGLRSLGSRILRQQRADGGWGDPHATACYLDCVASSCPSGPSIARALRFLDDSQQPDGSWLASDFYLMPGKTPDRIAWYRSDAVTTALCARALHRGLTALSGGLLA